MKKLLVLLILLWLCPLAHAQNPTCPTRPLGDATNACASTAFVNQYGTGTTTGTTTPNLPVIGNATGNGFAQGTRQGNTTKFATTTGAFTNGNCRSTDSNGNEIDAGVTCNGGAGSGTITAGSANQVPFYAGTGTTIAGGTVLYAGSMKCDGSTDDTAALQAAVTAATGLVIIPSGTCIISSTITMKAGVTINCSGSTITQANSTNLSEFIDFNTAPANGAGLRYCTIDGNVAGQTATVCSGITIFVGSANNVNIEENIIQNPMCDGIGITSGTSDNIVGNHFINGTYDNINITAAAQTTNNAHIIGNTSNNLGAHFLELYGSDYNIIDNNIVQGFNLPAMIDTVASSTSVTWVSGATFSSLRAGNFIVCNGSAGYQELFITKVVSSTSLTIGATTPAVAGASQHCIAGPGDLMDIEGSYNEIGNNILVGATTGGIVVANLPLVHETIQNNHIHDNSISDVGNGCIFVEAVSNSGAIMDDDSYTNNHLTNCGLGQTPLATKAAIIIDDGAPTGAIDQWFDGNIIIDNTSNTSYWMAMFGSLVQSEASTGKNTSRGMLANGIFNGIRSVTISGGWGAAASVNSFVSYGDSYQVAIGASGSGMSGNPSITVNKNAGGSEQPPLPVCTSSTSNGSSTTISVSTSSINQDVLVFNGTPVSGIIYTVNCK